MSFIADIWPINIDRITTNQFSSIAPELFLAVGVTIVWCYFAVSQKQDVVINGLRYIFIITLLLYVYSVSWPESIFNEDLIVQNGLFVLFSKILIIILALPILWLENLSITLALYFGAIILFNLSLICSADLLTTYVCLEGLSLVSYGVIATNKTQGSAESGLKYFLYGIVASALLVFGLSLLYLQSHELSWGGVYLFFAFNTFNNQIELQVLTLLLVITALIYKLSLFPFHFTLPDVYEGASWHTIAIVNLGVKFGVGLFLFRLWGLIITNQVLSEFLAIVLSWLTILSLIIGCFGALVQTSLKRFLAYTSINQSGFIIMGLLTNSTFGLESSILYIIVYMLSMILFFYAVDNISSDDITEISNLRGARRLSLVIALFSMAGIPPLFGFGSKYFVWLSLFDSVSSGMLVNQHNNAIKYLLIISIIMSLISAFYYLRLIKITSFKDNLITNMDINHPSMFISLCVTSSLILWPLFITILLSGLETYSLANYGSWVNLF